MKLGELAHKLGGQCRGDPDLEVTGLGTLEDANADEITFLASSTPRENLACCAAAAVILCEADLEAWSGPAIVCDNPHLGYARAARVLDNTPAPAPGVHPSAVVAKSACMARACRLGRTALSRQM